MTTPHGWHMGRAEPLITVSISFGFVCLFVFLMTWKKKIAPFPSLLTPFLVGIQ